MGDMNIAQARTTAEQIAEQLRALATDKGRSREDIQARLRELADVADNVALALTPRDPYDAAPTEWGIPV